MVKMIWNRDRKLTYPEEDKKEEEEDINVQGAEADSDLENPTVEKSRPIILLQSIYTALTLILTIGTLGLGWRQIAFGIAIDRFYLRLLFILAIIPQFWLALVSLPQMDFGYS